uniref:Conserved protein n=1 Tax=Haptophyceae sp. NIES-3900 TaxID=2748608 RepID=A0A7R6WD95_9EUKA|nr:conserved protein [Haptophyceae sp. NIES-3900]
MLIADDLDKLLKILPEYIKDSLKTHPKRQELIEIIMDLGRKPEARFPDKPIYLSNKMVVWQDLDYTIKRVGNFSGDNRAGIEQTLHRISSIRNREGSVVGLTSRVGRAIFGTISLIRDLLERGTSILVLGKPGVGKTTAIREIARVFSDEMEKRVVIIDTSNEIAGDGDIPHPAIGRARRMQVSQPELQHQVMIEAIENHMPEVIIIDEISTELEALAARTIAERGVILIGTAHGNSLENLIKNPTLSDLIGGIQYVTLGDNEAKRRGTKKSILERKASPAFEIGLEIHERQHWVVHEHVEQAVDKILQGHSPSIQKRYCLTNHYKTIICKQNFNTQLNLKRTDNKKNTWKIKQQEKQNQEKTTGNLAINSKKINTNLIFLYLYGMDVIYYSTFENIIRVLSLPIILTKEIRRADAILAVSSTIFSSKKLRKIAKFKHITIHSIEQATVPQITRALQNIIKFQN